LIIRRPVVIIDNFSDLRARSVSGSYKPTWVDAFPPLKASKTKNTVTTLTQFAEKVRAKLNEDEKKKVADISHHNLDTSGASSNRVKTTAPCRTPPALPPPEMAVSGNAGESAGEIEEL
jgi:hypothetical protein